MARRSPIEKAGDVLDRMAARQANVGRRYRFVSPAGQVLDTYELREAAGDVMVLVNQTTGRAAYASESWLRMRPTVSRAHWLPEERL